MKKHVILLTLFSIIVIFLLFFYLKKSPDNFNKINESITQNSSRKNDTEKISEPTTNNQKNQAWQGFDKLAFYARHRRKQ